MEFLNVGPFELIVIFVIALLLLGPERMTTTARSLGKWIYRMVRSPYWASIMDTSRELRDLPTKIVREAGLEESLKEINELNREIRKETNIQELDQAAKEMDNKIRQAANLANLEYLKKRSILEEKEKQVSEAEPDKNLTNNVDSPGEETEPPLDL
jgi:sec-independent protein translocase protein TatB